MSTTAREWDSLSIDEKLTELGFERNPDAEFDLASTATEKRLHAALDQLLDCGGLLTEIEAMVQPTATGVVGADIPGEMQETMKRIYELITTDEE